MKWSIILFFTLALCGCGDTAADDDKGHLIKALGTGMEEEQNETQETTTQKNEAPEETPTETTTQDEKIGISDFISVVTSPDTVKFISKRYRHSQACLRDFTKPCFCEIFQVNSKTVVKYSNHSRDHCHNKGLLEIQNGYTSTETNLYIQGYKEKGYSCHVTEDESDEEKNVTSIRRLFCTPPS